MKNVRPTIAPDVTRSLHDEKVKAQVMLEPFPQATPEPIPSPEAPKSDVHRQPAGNMPLPLPLSLVKAEFVSADERVAPRLLTGLSSKWNRQKSL